MKRTNNKLTADVLIIGSGLAGMLLALKLIETTNLSVAIACKGSLIDSNTAWAQGGLAAVTPSNIFDSPREHLLDTTSSGAGLTDERMARLIIEGGSELIEELLDQGTKFDQGENGKFTLALEGGHSRARVLHNKDATGRAIATSLARSLTMVQSEHPSRLCILTDTFAVALLEDSGHCLGATFDIGGETTSVVSRHTILATGGLGQVYSRTTNPAVATGDGIALAYRIGARLIDMEFVQFHPTALFKNGAPPFLISEAVRGAGAKLLDNHGKQFAKRFHPDGELATRDVVARAIHTTMQEQGSDNVYLDLSSIGAQEIYDRFPNIVDNCRLFGIDPMIEAIPVCPAAHYFMGGIWTDKDGRTSIAGLYAIGECASTGLHGANRLASNSLLEAGVMALRVAKHIEVISRSAVRSAMPTANEEMMPLSVPENIEFVKHSMYRLAGLVRTENGLKELSDIIANHPTYLLSGQVSRHQISQANMLLLSSLITSAARQRRESRGSHFRDDFRSTDDLHYLKRQYVTKQGWGWLSMETCLLQPGQQAALTA